MNGKKRPVTPKLEITPEDSAGNGSLRFPTSPLAQRMNGENLSPNSEDDTNDVSPLASPIYTDSRMIMGNARFQTSPNNEEIDIKPFDLGHLPNQQEQQRSNIKNNSKNTNIKKEESQPVYTNAQKKKIRKIVGDRNIEDPSPLTPMMEEMPFASTTTRINNLGNVEINNRIPLRSPKKRRTGKKEIKKDKKETTFKNNITLETNIKNNMKKEPKVHVEQQKDDKHSPTSKPQEDMDYSDGSAPFAVEDTQTTIVEERKETESMEQGDGEEEEVKPTRKRKKRKRVKKSPRGHKKSSPTQRSNQPAVAGTTTKIENMDVKHVKLHVETKPKRKSWTNWLKYSPSKIGKVFSKPSSTGSTNRHSIQQAKDELEQVLFKTSKHSKKGKKKITIRKRNSMVRQSNSLSTFEIFYVEGRKFFDKNQFDDALSTLKRYIIYQLDYFPKKLLEAGGKATQEAINEQQINASPEQLEEIRNHIGTAAYLIGQIYRKHRDVSNKAMKYYRIATSYGNHDACYQLGNIYKRSGHFEDAHHYFTIANDHPGAQTNLGIMYHYGQGVHQNYQKATEMFQIAAAKNYPRALECIGVMYFNGQGVAKHLPTALSYYQKAHDLGLHRTATVISRLETRIWSETCVLNY